MTALTLNQIKAQVSAIRAKSPRAKAIAIRTPHQWTGEPEYEDETFTIKIVQCQSPLAIRLALQAGQAESVITLILTNDDESNLDEDILGCIPVMQIVHRD
ncbi:hypothetical protein PN441_06680 [Spirulina major CS-329]|uniref:hypothetical protein n=1 Tax=Spirulina TaxID=1154 RepID=UPI00232CBC63|nr:MULTISPECIES: hypothetical protein [Spirulina]MDB9495456.1 hypothetical protein [Spirulina subsalsa CS-330]MDB9502752.1 hypothetical protein [Spirulina major CS-329]